MVTWKAILVVIAIGILLIAIGMWLGYRYISEQDEIRPRAQHEPSALKTAIILSHLSEKIPPRSCYLF